MLIEMLKTCIGAADDEGVSSKQYRKGEQYKVPLEVPKSVAKNLVELNFAKEVEDENKPLTPVQTLKEQNKEVKDEEIIDVDDEEVEEAKQLPKLPNKPLFSKYNNNRKR